MSTAKWQHVEQHTDNSWLKCQLEPEERGKGVWTVTANGEQPLPVYLCLSHLSVLYCISLSVCTSSDTKRRHSTRLCRAHHPSLGVCLFAEGTLEMMKDGLKVLTVEPEDLFGELALLYNCTHTYSVSGNKALFYNCMQISRESCQPEWPVEFLCG